MRENVGNIDRFIRIVIGLVLLSLVFYEPVGWWGLIGLVPFFTGIFRNCPLYNLIGMNTCPSAR